MPQAISLDAIGQPGQFGVSQDLDPARQVEGGLRSEVRKLDSDRHGTKIAVISLCGKRRGLDLGSHLRGARCADQSVKE